MQRLERACHVAHDTIVGFSLRPGISFWVNRILTVIVHNNKKPKRITLDRELNRLCTYQSVSISYHSPHRRLLHLGGIRVEDESETANEHHFFEPTCQLTSDAPQDLEFLKRPRAVMSRHVLGFQVAMALWRCATNLAGAFAVERCISAGLQYTDFPDFQILVVPMMFSHSAVCSCQRL